MSTLPIAGRESPEARLARWLAQHGLRANPFATWSADTERDLASYYLDIESFDDILRDRTPTIVFAARGCGKTAFRQMLASQCLPDNRALPLDDDARRLAAPYTYGAFSALLERQRADGRPIRTSNHVGAILGEGLAALDKAGKRDPAIPGALYGSRLAAYTAAYAPHLLVRPPEDSAFLHRLGPKRLLEDFVGLLAPAGIGELLVLVDGLDEWPEAAADLNAASDFLCQLIGVPELLTAEGVAFKFFLPAALEPVLRRTAWYRSDRFRVRPLVWTTDHLVEMLGQRLFYFATDCSAGLRRIGALCEDDLAARIDRELADEAQGAPRAALLLANLLLRRHYEQGEVPGRIRPATWYRLKADWPRLSRELLSMDLFPGAAGQPPRLRVVDEEIWLGDQRITDDITRQEALVLRALLRKAPNFCTTYELKELAWPKKEPGNVTDAALAKTISPLREVLTGKSAGRNYIETVRGRGYRLLETGFEAAKS